MVRYNSLYLKTQYIKNTDEDIVYSLHTMVINVRITYITYIFMYMKILYIAIVYTLLTEKCI